MEEVLKCPKCHSSQTRARIKTNDRICNTCKHTWILNIEEVLDGDI